MNGDELRKFERLCVSLERIAKSLEKLVEFKRGS